MEKINSKYSIIINPNQDDLQGANFKFERFFFNEYRHLTQQSTGPLYSYYLVDEHSHSIEARFSCFISDNQVFSPIRAPFGGLEFNPKILTEDLYSFWQWIANDLKKHWPSAIYINTFPFAYHPENQAIQTNLFLQKGFQILQSELNYHLEISNSQLRNLLHLSEKRRLDKCHQAGFKFEEWIHPDLTRVYDFVKKARQRKDYPITLDEKSFIKLFQSFPNDFQVFRVIRGTEIAALTVTVKINQRILYNFYPADNELYLKYSPQVLLIEGLYQYAQQKGFQILDLGIATEASNPNFGLIRFKRNLGAIVSLKLKFVYNLPNYDFENLSQKPAST
jgi:hypothetical protein